MRLATKTLPRELQSLKCYGNIKKHVLFLRAMEGNLPTHCPSDSVELYFWVLTNLCRGFLPVRG